MIKVLNWQDIGVFKSFNIDPSYEHIRDPDGCISGDMDISKQQNINDIDKILPAVGNVVKHAMELFLLNPICYENIYYMDGGTFKLYFNGSEDQTYSSPDCNYEIEMEPVYCHLRDQIVGQILAAIGVIECISHNKYESLKLINKLPEHRTLAFISN